VRRYYYTLSTLPMLSYEGAPPFSIEEFYEMCRGNIADEDLMVLMEAGLEPPENNEESERSGSDALDSWLEWETALRNELVSYRAQKLAWETERYKRDGEVVTGVFDIARNAASQESPLQAEDLLNKARWNYLEELETGHFFELTNLVVYSLKLQLLLRKARFTQEQGEDAFKGIYQTVREDIQSA